MIKRVGIDFAGIGEHKVRCLDERAQMCDGFGFQTTPDGLAKMPFIDSERLENEITARKTRIGSIVDGYLPGVRQAFSDSWSLQARAFLRTHLNPLIVVRAGEKAIHTFLTRARPRGKKDTVESHLVYLACQNTATLYELSSSTEVVNDDFFAALQEEITRELRLMEIAETESEAIAQHLEKLYQELHPSDNLRTIPGVGEHTAPIFLATVGNPARFRSQSAFANYTGVVPAARQSSNVEAKGLRMTKAGPAIMKWALYQAGQIGRRYDPQLACIYYREMVYHGKNHKQAMGAVMSHMGARVLAVAQEDRPYELRDIQGKPISREEARRLILSSYQVPEEIRQER